MTTIAGRDIHITISIKGVVGIGISIRVNQHSSAHAVQSDMSTEVSSANLM